MAVKLDGKMKELINDPYSIKMLATVDRDGIPHIVVKKSIRVNEEGNIEYLELIESSQTNKNMVNSIWFGKTVAVNVQSGNVSYQIKGVPYRAVIAGQQFEKEYDRIRKKLGDVDLSTIWLIRPTEVIEESFEKRKKEEEEAHPILQHLDRLVVKKERE